MGLPDEDKAGIVPRARKNALMGKPLENHRGEVQEGGMARNAE